MRSIHSWRDMEEHGIICLTGESCAYSMRLLCDLTEKGAEIVRSFFGLASIGGSFVEEWNSGHEEPHVASIMLPHGIWLELGAFALLHGGARQVVIFDDGQDAQHSFGGGRGVYGIDDEEEEERARDHTAFWYCCKCSKTIDFDDRGNHNHEKNPGYYATRCHYGRWIKNPGISRHLHHMSGRTE